MDIITDLIEMALEVILTWLSPQGVAKKVNNKDTSMSTKLILIILFTVVYGATLLGLALSFLAISDVLYKVFAAILFIFLLVYLVKFYFKIFKY